MKHELTKITALFQATDEEIVVRLVDTGRTHHGSRWTTAPCPRH
ncbi:hypothetical protein [Caldalkalibacillus uzonensis]|nr:hypothetical protein [Caldalkalibacillus uzonensis]